MGSLADLCASEVITKKIDEDYEEGYNKAIDEFAEVLKEKWIEADDLSISSEFFEFVEEISEELKGVQNE